MKVGIKVRLKPVILDPQGKTVHQAMKHLGYENIENVRIGKLIEFEVATSDAAEAKKIANEVSERLLSNPVMETYEIEIN